MLGFFFTKFGRSAHFFSLRSISQWELKCHLIGLIYCYFKNIFNGIIYILEKKINLKIRLFYIFTESPLVFSIRGNVLLSDLLLLIELSMCGDGGVSSKIMYSVGC